MAVGAGVFGFIGAAPAADRQLVWSATSGPTNQSTDALNEGRHAHAVRFAKDVLRSKTSPANHLIARHNLCLAYLAQGKADDAKPFCDAVMASQARYHIVERDGRPVAVEMGAAEITDDQAQPTLEAALRANVARVQATTLAESR